LVPQRVACSAQVLCICVFERRLASYLNDGVWNALRAKLGAGNADSRWWSITNAPNLPISQSLFLFGSIHLHGF
jgi:hypothetical protein